MQPKFRYTAQENLGGKGDQSTSDLGWQISEIKSGASTPEPYTKSLYKKSHTHYFFQKKQHVQKPAPKTKDNSFMKNLPAQYLGNTPGNRNAYDGKLNEKLLNNCLEARVGKGKMAPVKELKSEKMRRDIVQWRFHDTM